MRLTVAESKHLFAGMADQLDRVVAPEVSYARGVSMRRTAERLALGSDVRPVYTVSAVHYTPGQHITVRQQ